MTSFSKAIAAGALCILICIGALSYWSEVRNEADREWVTHTLHVLEKLQGVRIDMAQAETGQRGFMLTGQDRYLELYESGIRQVRQDMEKLPDLIADNPREREAIIRLNPLIAHWMKELGNGVEARKRSGLFAGVEAVMRTDNGEKWSELTAAQIGEMRDTEDHLLTSRLETAAASTRKIKFIIAFGNSLAILILIVKGYVLQVEIGKRNAAERNLKDSNDRLEHRTAELSETNIEMEGFAYSVAHDLRAPLRHISGYSGVLVQDWGDHLGADGLRCLAKITDCAQKMGRLVDDLLRLSQVGRQELAFQDTHLDLILKHALEETAPELVGRHVEWQIEELFSAQCDPGLMKQVFVNLLSNAVKYTRTREHAVIHVGQTMRDGERVIYIRDNGVGFEMQYVGKLFGVFQRLHKTRDFEGTGVGLAIVQRVIRKHGGRIWAEAELDRGATFFFTLETPGHQPKAAPELTVAVEEEMYVASR